MNCKMAISKLLVQINKDYIKVIDFKYDVTIYNNYFLALNNYYSY